MALTKIYRSIRDAIEHRHYARTCARLTQGERSFMPVPWHEDPRTRFWAHAGGGRLHVYGNSMEAYDDAVSSGFGVVEADVMITADGVPVMSHRFRPNNEIVFDRVPTLKEFLSTRINGKYTPLSLEQFIYRYQESDVYVSIDPSPTIRQAECGEQLVDFLESRAPKAFLKKVIYQINGLTQIEKFISRNPFGALHYGLDSELGDFPSCWKMRHLIPVLVRSGIGSVSISDRPITHENELKSIISSLSKVGIKVSVPGVNSASRMKRWFGLGAFCINTDFLSPKELNL